MREHNRNKQVTEHQLENVKGGNKILWSKEIHTRKNIKKGNRMTDIYGASEQKNCETGKTTRRQK
jgi:hypothetical protein